MHKDINNTNQLSKEATMIECEKVWDLLSLYADGEATPAEASIVEAHIAVCADCARDLQYMRETHEVLSEAPEVEPPVNLREAILAATVYRPSLPQRIVLGARKVLGPAPVRYGVLATAGAAAALTAVFLHNGGGPVMNMPTVPPVVASSPAETSTTEPLGSEPSVNLLDAYQPEATRPNSTPAATGRRLAAAIGSGRLRHSSTKQLAARPSSQDSKNGSTGAARTSETADDLTSNGATASVPAPDFSPDPEPSIRTIASAGETSSQPSSENVSAPESTARSVRIVLTASAAALDPQHVATLADLRRSLSRSDGTSVAGTASELRPRDRQIRVNLLRGSF